MHDIATRRGKVPSVAAAFRAIGGKLVIRRERWGLSLCGWAAILIGAASVSAITFFGIYPFLAVTETIPGEILVVEDWVHDYAIIAAIEEAKRRSAAEIFTTGGPVKGSGPYTSVYGTSAHVSASRLRAFGVPAANVHVVPAYDNGRDRTFAAALALRQWLRERGRDPRSMDVVTETVHARRTRLLFQEAFGSKTKIGIIAVRDPDYDPKYWWRYSEGVREVIGEAIAYFYAKFLFWPPKQRD
jgi:hypothetical protein